LLVVGGVVAGPVLCESSGTWNGSAAVLGLCSDGCFFLPPPSTSSTTALGVDAGPGVMLPLVDVCVDAALVAGGGAGDAPGELVGALDDGDIADHACIDDALLDGEQGLRDAAKGVGDGLVAGADGAVGADVDVARGQQVRQAVLILVDQGDAPVVLEVLELLEHRGNRGLREGGRGGERRGKEKDGNETHA
jgi:hypothetical protein